MTTKIEWTLEFREIARVFAVQFAHRFKERGIVDPSGKLELNSTRLDYPLHAYVAWPDLDEDRENVTIDDYDARYLTPAAEALIESIIAGNLVGTVYKFFMIKPRPYVNAKIYDELQLESLNTVCLMSRRNTDIQGRKEHDHMRADVYYTIVKPEES